jgi:Domain of unknown function (DUF4331)
MSHHLDSPASRRDPRLNLTDMYVFDGAAGTALAMIVNTSLAGDERIPGFHPEGRYEFKVHFDGEDRESLTYRVTFGEAGDDGEQPLTVHRLTGAEAGDDAATGAAVAQGRTGTGTDTGDGDGEVRVWAGAAADPFYLDLGQLGHVLEGLQHRTAIELSDWAPEKAANTFAGSSIAAIVLEVPTTDQRLSVGQRVGVWGATKLATDAGGWRQINRAGIPMVWPLFRAIGGDDESHEYARDTTAHPADDVANDGARIREMVGATAGFTGATNPGAYAELVTRRLLPDLLPYEIGTPAAFGFAGFNGRALGDNAPEVMFSLITNSGFATGLTAGDAVETRQTQFPYVVASGGSSAATR